MSDLLQRFLHQAAPVRGEIVSLDTAWLEIVRRHPELPAGVLHQLGELSAAALLLSATLKFDGKLILQIHGDGPVSLFVVECDASGEFRSTVKLRENQVVPDSPTLSQLVNAQGNGRFVVTLDPRDRSSGKQTYQGIVPFEGDTVAQVLERYMQRSEQVPTRLWLAANSQRACGLLLQKLPDEGGSSGAADEDGWNRLGLLAATLTTQELIDLRSDAILHRLFWQEPLHAFDKRGCRFHCSCTRDKVSAMLRMLGREEVDAIIAERGQIEVHCDFCNQPYGFDRVDSAGLFVSALTADGSKRPH